MPDGSQTDPAGHPLGVAHAQCRAQPLVSSSQTWECSPQTALTQSASALHGQPASPEQSVLRQVQPLPSASQPQARPREHVSRSGSQAHPSAPGLRVQNGISAAQKQLEGSVHSHRPPAAHSSTLQQAQPIAP
jgi:hypothetical protein